MDRSAIKNRACLIAALILVAASLGYWSAFAVNSYRTFHSYWDVGSAAYDMYYHIHAAGMLHGLQYLSFATHLAPDQLLVLLVFYLYQSPLTLLLIQAVVISFTGMLIFFMARDLLKSSVVGLLLCLAFLLNPGLHGILVFDYHAEFLIIPLVLLSFYFFMKGRRTAFIISLLLLLGSVETATFVALAMGVGLLSYELSYDRKSPEKIHRARTRNACYIIVLSLIAMAAYAGASLLLANAYTHGLYQGLPLALQTTGFESQQASQLVSTVGGSGGNAIGSINGIYNLYGLMVVIFGFGIAALFIPETTILLILPWLVEGFLLGNGRFFLIWYQYFSYVLGGMIIATFLAMRAISKGSQRFRVELKVLGGHNPMALQYKALLFLPILLFIMSPIFVLSANLNNPLQNFFFENSAAQTSQMNQLYSVMSLIPQNATVMAPIFVVAHLTNRAEVTPILPAGQQWFTPEYLLLDFNRNLSSNAFSFNQPNIANAVLAKNSYYLYAKNGTAELYRLSRNYS